MGPLPLFRPGTNHHTCHQKPTPFRETVPLSMCFFPTWSLAALWNRNYFLRFRFRLLKSYGSGSGSNFWKVMVPVPTYEKFRFRSSSISRRKKANFSKKMLIKILPFLLSKLFYKAKVYSYGSGSGSTSQKVTVPPVPVPQRWSLVIIGRVHAWDAGRCSL